MGIKDIIQWLIDTNLIILVKIVIILLITKVIVQFIKSISNKKEDKNLLIKRFITNIAIASVYLFGIIAAIYQVPQLNNAARTILAGSGIVALAVSFSAQESLGNIISGIFLTLFRPFEIGDRVTLVNSGLTGIVEDITLRHTVIKNFNNSRVIIPNATISKEIIENSNLIDSRASSFIDISIAYESDIDKAMQIMADIIGNHPLYIDTRTEKEKEYKPKVKVYARELGDSGICLRASMWTKTVNDNFDACSDVRIQIKKAFDLNGIEIPYNKIEIVKH